MGSLNFWVGHTPSKQIFKSQALLNWPKSFYSWVRIRYLGQWINYNIIIYLPDLLRKSDNRKLSFISVLGGKTYVGLEYSYQCSTKQHILDKTVMFFLKK